MITVRYAVVTGINPLRVRFDGETADSQKTYKKPRYYVPQMNDRIVFLVLKNGATAEYIFLNQME